MSEAGRSPKRRLPDGITVVLSESRLAHIVAGHENLAGHVDRVA